MQKYIVLGGIMEYMAHLHIEADSELAALEAWKKEFPDCNPETYDPDVWHLSDEVLIEKYWKQNGYSFRADGYPNNWIDFAY